MSATLSAFSQFTFIFNAVHELGTHLLIHLHLDNLITSAFMLLRDDDRRSVKLILFYAERQTFIPKLTFTPKYQAAKHLKYFLIKQSKYFPLPFLKMQHCSSGQLFWSSTDGAVLYSACTDWPLPIRTLQYSSFAGDLFALTGKNLLYAVISPCHVNQSWLHETGILNKP